MNLITLANRPTEPALAQWINLNPHREWMNFAHFCIMGRQRRHRQSKISWPYSNWPTTERKGRLSADGTQGCLVDSPIGLLLRNPGFAYMHLSKARLVEGWRSAPALEMDFLEVLKDARECFEVAASLIRTVEARILIAGAVVMAEDDKRPRRHASPG
jgi:hypothetical protein